jgi:hypothetical protein
MHGRSLVGNYVYSAQDEGRKEVYYVKVNVWVPEQDYYWGNCGCSIDPCGMPQTRKPLVVFSYRSNERFVKTYIAI